MLKLGAKSLLSRQVVEFALNLQALDASPSDAALYSQRAQTHIKLENFLEAAEDAGKAIELDPSTGRHYHRRGYGHAVV